MRITYDNLSKVKAAVDGVLEYSQPLRAIDDALTTMGFKVRDEFKPDSEPNVNPVQEVWLYKTLRKSVTTWLRVQEEAEKWGRTADDNDRARIHRQKINKLMPELRNALINLAFDLGRVYDK